MNCSVASSIQFRGFFTTNTLNYIVFDDYLFTEHSKLIAVLNVLQIHLRDIRRSFDVFVCVTMFHIHSNRMPTRHTRERTSLAFTFYTFSFFQFCRVFSTPTPTHLLRFALFNYE